MTYSEAVSKITNSLKLLNKDERISRRYVLHVLKDISSNLISQKLLDRTLGREMNLYTKIECFEFKKEAYIAECVKTCLLGGKDIDPFFKENKIREIFGLSTLNP